MLSFTLEFNANSIIGHFSTQSFWSASTIDRKIWPIERFTRSVIPSVWGWNDVDIRSFAPSKWCTSRHHRDVNFESLSETMDLGSPCNFTISFTKIHDNCDAVIVVFTGIRCTREVILQMTTHR